MIFSKRKNELAKFLIWSFAAMISVWMLTLGFPDEASALLVVFFSAGIFVFLFRRFTDDKEFITNLFLAALVVRLGFGLFVHLYDIAISLAATRSTYHALWQCHSGLLAWADQ